MRRKRDSHLRHMYGISEDEYNRMLHKQGYACAICKKKLGAKNLCVDHDHKTGKVRGLLCHSCNLALGSVEDSPRILAAMMVYLMDNGISYNRFED